ncbi:hypothetical protein M9Y10_032736 [Tritrichomonas musculus]|uniref:Tetraspanin family protein n=1 Tax=Tritrichomonas musculus TaxID=1915356 RepID=A0ABR2GZA2_9EUKA
MKIADVFSGRRFILAYISVGVIAVGLFADLIINALWFSYFNPYGGHSEGWMSAQYFCTLFSFIFSLLALVLVILIVVSYFFISAISENPLISLLISIIMIVFSIISIATSIYTGVYGSLSFDHIHYSPDGGYVINAKCYNPIISSFTKKSFDYAYKKSQEEKYANWIYKIASKVIKDFDKSKEYKDQFVLSIATFVALNQPEKLESGIISLVWVRGREFNSSLCSSLGVPSIIFAVFQIVGLILLCIASFCGAKKDNEASINEEA